MLKNLVDDTIASLNKKIKKTNLTQFKNKDFKGLLLEAFWTHDYVMYYHLKNHYLMALIAQGIKKGGVENEKSY